MAKWWQRAAGALRRAIGRGRGRERGPQEGAGPAAPEVRGGPAEGAPEAPKAPAEPAPSVDEEGGGGGGEEPEEREYYPPGMSVSVGGTWRVSSSVWTGIISADLSGDQVRGFLDAIDSGDEEEAIYIAAQGYDTMGSGFADRLELGQSDWLPPQFDFRD